MYHANINLRKAGAITSITGRVDFRLKKMPRDRAGYFIIKQGYSTKKT